VIEQIDPATLTCKVPGLVLQPLVENAIRYGKVSSPEGGIVKILTSLIDRQISITVTDNGDGFKNGDPFKPEHALDNIRKRIRLLYGNDGKLAVNRNRNTGETEVTIRIPAECGK
jgi:LytS/YehU family sensor histidine kinase